MKRKITKAEFDALSEEMKKFYKADGDNYQLVIEGEDDPAELRRARDREKAAAQAEKKRADELQAKLDGVDTEAARKAGDIATLEKSWQTKLETEKQTGQTKVSALQQYIQKSLVDGQAANIAAELAGDNAFVLLPHVKDRLRVEYVGEEPKVRILDASGQLSALSIEDLKKELASDKRFASIIIASKATGGAGAGGNGGGKGSGAAYTGKKFADLNDAERNEFYKSDPEGFKRASEAYKKALRGY